MTYDNPFFVSKMRKFTDITSIFFIYGLEKDSRIFLILYDQFYPTDHKVKNFHLSVLLTFKILEFIWENLELVYLHHLGLDVIVSVQDVANWCYPFQWILILKLTNVY